MGKVENMKELFEVFRMDSLSTHVRIRVILKLGELINREFGSNVTEPIVYELVKILDPNNKDVETDHYLRHK